MTDSHLPVGMCVRSYAHWQLREEMVVYARLHNGRRGVTVVLL
jgi:hypothetical protein